jgi:metallophosphoesterase (TIGR03767 family)
VNGRRPPLTTDRRLGPGAVLREGRLAPYQGITIIPGEPHVVRDDLTGPDPGWAHPGTGRSLLCLAHLTDLQLADVQSPARFEFLNRYFADPRYGQIVPVQRPQEALTPHAVAATLQTISAAAGPVTRMSPALAITTGDAIDNAQWNEMQVFLDLLDGGQVRPGSGGPGYAGPQSRVWPDDIFWRPDGDGAAGPDIFTREFGFPRHPGLLAAAMREFSSPGLAIPWLSSFGNHEGLIQGVGQVTPALAAALTGDRKPLSLPDGFDHEQALELFTHHPEAFLAGPDTVVPADPGRRPITRQDFVEAHFRPGSRPFGHGFTEQNRREGTAYYVHDTPAVRFIALDTNCAVAGAAGAIDSTQARWLADRLAEVHAHYQGPDGEQIRTGNEDRLVVVFSHHGLDTITSTLPVARPAAGPLLGAPQIEGLLHRFGNVVLWLNGHTHTNTIRARPNRSRPGRGFWEVTTCAIVDWPCQARLVELTAHDGYLSITCTMIDHDSPLAAQSLDRDEDLAALHRELAANMPFAGAHTARPGTPGDRNVELLLAEPFPLTQLPQDLVSTV